MGLWLAGCQPSLNSDAPALQARTSAPAAAPDCGSCHFYPLHDVNHNYHLNGLNPREAVQSLFVYERKNGIIVCMDCHFGSVAHRKYNWYDTLWGTEGDVRATADKLPNDPIYRIDTIPGFLPLPAGMRSEDATSDRVNAMMESAARIGSLVSWMTSRAHMNGQVDVEFSPNIVLDTNLSKSAFRASDLSCSSIECHNAPKKTYRWASKAKGLNGCPTLEHFPELDTSCNYSPKQEPK